jgi:hypothetical protein
LAVYVKGIPALLLPLRAGHFRAPLEMTGAFFLPVLVRIR